MCDNIIMYRGMFCVEDSVVDVVVYDNSKRKERKYCTLYFSDDRSNSSLTPEDSLHYVPFVASYQVLLPYYSYGAYRLDYGIPPFFAAVPVSNSQ